MKSRTNFDFYLRQQLKDADFASRYEQASKDWQIALQRGGSEDSRTSREGDTFVTSATKERFLKSRKATR